MLENHYVGCVGTDGFDLLLCIGLFADADAHLGGNPGKCSKGHIGKGTWALLDSVKVPLELCAPLSQ